MFHEVVLWDIFFYNCRILRSPEFVQEKKFVVLYSNSFYEASFKEDAAVSTSAHV